MGVELFSTSICHHSETHESVREWRKFFPDLQGACASGDIDLALELCRSHPERWRELDADHLAFLMDCVLLMRPKDFDEEALQSGKKEIFYLIVSHENWAPTDLENLLFPLLVSKNLSFDQEESVQLICAFSQVDRLEEISVGLLADLMKALLICEPNGDVRDFFQVVTSLPNWRRIPPFAYDKILYRVHFPFRTVEELEILFSHPNANRQQNLDLSRVAWECRDREDVLAWLAKDERWGHPSAASSLNWTS
jgi:hypothetical protein